MNEGAHAAGQVIATILRPMLSHIFSHLSSLTDQYDGHSR
jgi:hypothetical protein